MEIYGLYMGTFLAEHFLVFYFDPSNHDLPGTNNSL
jgi:hypothetical protein